jgi:glycosyltransferase involved in cell wall biosynthesis
VTHRPLRITFVLPTLDLSGGVRVIATVCDELAAMGHAPLVVAGPSYRPTIRERVRVAVKGARHKWWTDPDEHHFVGRATPITRTGHTPITADDLPDADIVIATWWETAEWAASYPASKGFKGYYVQHHEVHMQGQPPDRVNATFKLPLHKVCCSRWVLEQIQPFCSAPPDLATYGVDRALFDAPPREKQPEPTVGFMYSDVRFKGTDTILKALTLARQRVPNLRVITFGTRTPSPELPLPDGARFTLSPPQNTLKHHYAGADAWILGSRAEGFGLPILEAMACRTPVISTRTGGALDLIDHGHNGLIVPVEDPEAMAGAIADIAARSTDSWRAMSQAAHDAAIRCTWRSCAEQLLAALTGAMSRAASARAAS